MLEGISALVSRKKQFGCTACPHKVQSVEENPQKFPEIPAFTKALPPEAEQAEISLHTGTAGSQLASLFCLEKKKWGSRIHFFLGTVLICDATWMLSAERNQLAEVEKMVALIFSWIFCLWAQNYRQRGDMTDDPDKMRTIKLNSVQVHI